MTVVNLKLVDKTNTQRKQKITLIGSGKGGVGRTWYAISLAQCLSQNGQKVLLVDGDLEMANIDIQLGLMARLDMGHYFQNIAPLSEIVHEFSDGGFDILPGRSGSGDFSNLPELLIDTLASDIREIASHYDHIIIDTGSGLNAATKSMAKIADKCLMILTCEPTSIINAYSFVKGLNQINRNMKFEMIVNQSDSEVEAEQTYLVLNNICEKFLNINLNLLGVVSNDDSVKSSIQNQTLHALRNPTSQALQSIAQMVGSF